MRGKGLDGRYGCTGQNNAIQNNRKQSHQTQREMRMVVMVMMEYEAHQEVPVNRFTKPGDVGKGVACSKRYCNLGGNAMI